MKVEIKETVSVVKTIDVDLPYYYKHDFDMMTGDTVIFGKIMEDKSIAIKESGTYQGSITYEVEIEEHLSIKTSGLSSYFNDEYKSNESEFLEAKERMMEFMKQI